MIVQIYFFGTQYLRINAKLCSCIRANKYPYLTVVLIRRIFDKSEAAWYSRHGMALKSENHPQSYVESLI